MAEVYDRSISRKIYLVMMLCQTLGVQSFTDMPNLAIARGALGYVIGYVLTYIVIGMPILYMEFIVSQFTSRDCIDVWKIRSCLSHIGYFHIVWQIVMILNNHTMLSFMIHYALISFEDPIPFYKCGHWSTEDCNILRRNYTVDQDCIKKRQGPNVGYCDNLTLTFPEIQYWRSFIVQTGVLQFNITWQICLASGCACIIIYFSCFKRMKSVKCFLILFTLYPILGYIALLIGSMMQKGIVLLYDEAMDTKFEIFVYRYSVSEILIQVIYSLNLGTGLSFNLGTLNGFHAPCYSNTIVTIAICTAFSLFTACTVAMMVCPYAYEHGTTPMAVITMRVISSLFEKIPRILYEYTNAQIWLVLLYSSNAMLALAINILIILCSLEMLMFRYKVFNSYPGLSSFVGAILIFIVTAPLLGNPGVFVIFTFCKQFQLITLFFVVLECLVFIVWYGVENFCEDIHFMEGIRPNNYMKVAWVFSTAVVIFVYIVENIKINLQQNWKFGSLLGYWVLYSCKLVIVLGILLKLLVAAIRKKFKNCVKLNPRWGPHSDLLLRSRAMFSAQAMTKEYMYRQYHLQAGILERMKTSNVRVQYEKQKTLNVSYT